MLLTTTNNNLFDTFFGDPWFSDPWFDDRDIHLLPETSQDETEDDAQENHIRSQGSNCIHRILVHLSESPDDDAYEGAHSQQSSE